MPFETRTAFSPGHITGFFRVCNHFNPHQKGSIGAGLVLNKGIYSTVTPFVGSGVSSVFLNGKLKSTTLADDSTNTVLTVISELSSRASQKYGFDFHFKVEEIGNIPAGCGFGLSAAGALSTAFAINSSLKLDLSKEELVEIAHYSEVINGSGLGDVVGESVGGLAVREIPGGSAHGTFYSISLSKEELGKKIYCLVLGELSTKEVITNSRHIQNINSAGKSALFHFLKKPSLSSFMENSKQFTKTVGLLSAEAEKVIDSIDPEDGIAAQAMLGNTVFALSSGREGADEHILKVMKKFGDVYECRIETKGPRVCLSDF